MVSCSNFLDMHWSHKSFKRFSFYSNSAAPATSSTTQLQLSTHGVAAMPITGAVVATGHAVRTASLIGLI